MIVDQQLLSCSPPMLGLFEKNSASSHTASSGGGGGASSGGGGSAGDLDDLNRALYDLGAQDLLDVWEAMGSEDGSSSISSGSSCLNNNILSSTAAATATPLDGLSSSNLVLKDHLLTDSILSDQEFPPASTSSEASASKMLLKSPPVVKQEHSYSNSSSNNNVKSSSISSKPSNGVTSTATMSMAAGSDGDSMPGSPVSLPSLQDDMETECYPCIPMQSASNQKNSSNNNNNNNNNSRSRGNLKRTAAHLHQLDLGSGETITIKAEPVSRGSSVDDDDDDEGGKVDVVGNTNNSCKQLSQQQLGAAAQLSQLLPQLTPVQVPPGNSLLLKSQQQQQVQFVRPKHPQSLLKPSLLPQTPAPVTTRTILVTTAAAAVNNSCNTTAAAVSCQPPTAAAASKLLFSRLAPPGAAATASPNGLSQQQLSNNSCNQYQLSAPTVVSLSSGVRLSPQPIQCIKGAPITTSLISSQPADSNGILVLTDEEKKTLIAEGYPIPSRLPLTKAEEKSLKKIRRKIKNKISAQESRRKKKEFVDTLERQVEVASQELVECKRKCNQLEKENAALLQQLRKLQQLVGVKAVNEAVVADQDDVESKVNVEEMVPKVEIKVEESNELEEEEEENIEEDDDDEGDIEMKEGTVCDGIGLD